ncbi:diguanylate cyclase (GGDEF) domain-containing protein [Lachnospiraceae bacterium NE2001]|nr:diguanylate cyclase (GGDEF) domain-containing protein [Lachnospiraceae bacterium NE2001]
MKKKIAIFSTGWCSEILSQFLTGMQNALADTRADLFLFLCYPIYIDSHAMKHGEMNIFTLPDLSEFDGTVIFGSGLNFPGIINNIIDRSHSAGIPVIMQGGRHEGAYYIGSDNYLATMEMCAHLEEEHNAKKIIFFAGTVDSHDSEVRLRAVKEYLSKQGRQSDLLEVHYTNWENAAVTRYINDFVAKGLELPDAFICANDGLAMECCISLNNHGYKVPDDVLVTGYDFIDDSQIFDPAIASVDQCFTEMGEAAARLWSEADNGTDKNEQVIIPCKFIPGESCNCYSYRDSDKIRRRVGRENFSKRSMTTYFNRKLNQIDSTVLSCLTFQEFLQSLRNLLIENHDYEGDSFHLLLEPNFGLSIYDQNIKLKRTGYSKYLDVLYSTEDGITYEDEQFASKDLVPGYNSEGKNHLYVFLPLHEADEAYGYLIFRDCMEKVENHFLQTYQSRMGLVFDKFRHALSLDLINKRLIEVMRRDPLTNVNNRIAYDDKEKYFQSEINMGTNPDFAIAMFDVNNLKLINDSKGHDAGDSYLIRACRLICDVFKHSPVYRIGGDEFVAFLTGDDYENRDILMGEIKDRMNPYSTELPLPPNYVSIACGMASFDSSTDSSIQDVYKRADEDMYQNKAKMKGHS